MVKSKFYNLDTDTTLSSNSDYYIPSEKAIKTYVDNKDLSAGTGIDITNKIVSNSGVREISTGATNGTISVNTGGTSAEVSVYGLGSAAYTDSTDYASSDIEDLIPAQASSSNQLADKDFVNSSIATNTANFIGTFTDIISLEAYSGTVTNNDYAFVTNSVIKDNGNDWTSFSDLDNYDKSLLTNLDYAWVINGTKFNLYRFNIIDQEWVLRLSDIEDKSTVTLNDAYNRYKAIINESTVTWDYEYTLNNSSFTADQWAAINSGITSGDVDLIQSAIQPSDLATVATSGEYSDLSNKPTIGNATLTIQKNGTTINTFTANATSNVTADISVPTKVSDLSNDSGFITGITSSDVTTALGYTPYNSSNPNGYTSNIGTVTSVNNTSPDGNGNVSINIPTVNDATLTIQKNNTNVGTFTANASSDSTINITVPTDTGDLTNNAGYIKSVNANSVSISTNGSFSVTCDGTTAFSYDYGTGNAGFLDEKLRIYYNDVENEITLAADENDVNFTTNSGYKLLYNDNEVATISQIPTVNNATLTIQKNGTDVQTFTANASSDVTANIVVPTATSDLSNDSGFLTSADLPTNHVTTDTAQDITGTKTFIGQKKIGFKQSSSSDKLGFTLYNNSGTEKGYLEYNPTNTVDSVPLMTLGNYASATAGLTHVGFRKYSSISGANGAYNLLAPLISDAKTPFNLTTTYTNFYLPLGYTNGTTTITTAKSGIVDISTLLPTVGNGTITINQGGTQKGTFTVNQSGDTTINLNDGGGTVDQTYDASSTNAQSGTAVAEALTGYATETFVTNQGYITGISSSDVTTALGYTPYNSSNPAGYTSNVGTVTSINNTQPDATGNVSINIPAAQVNSDWNAQSGVAQILNKPTIPTMTYNSSTKTLTWS